MLQSDNNRCSVYSVGVWGTDTPQCWPDRRSPTAGMTKASVERLCGGMRDQEGRRLTSGKDLEQFPGNF